jgi:hypothetical protein
MAIEAASPTRSTFSIPALGRVLSLAGLLAALLQAAAFAQPALPPGVRGPAAGAATRPVARYLDLERDLQEAVAAKNEVVVQKLLSDDFEVRTAAAPDALQKEEWLRSEFAHAGRTRVRQFSLREFDDVAVASFLLQSVKSDGSAAARRSPLFVVDVWRQSTGKLLIRYTDQPAHPPLLANRPSGRQ